MLIEFWTWELVFWQIGSQGASQAIHEFQFLPENPSLRSESYERTLPSHYYGSPADVQSARFPSSSGRSFKHGNEQEPSGHNLQGQTPVLSLLPHPGRQGNHLSPASGGVDIAPRINPLVNDNINANYVVRPATGPDNQIITPDRHVVLEERLEKKCKVWYIAAQIYHVRALYEDKSSWYVIFSFAEWRG